MRSIGILGTGRMGTRLARLFAEAGHTVWLGSRTPARARQVVKQLDHPAIRSATYEQACDALVVLPALSLRHGLIGLLRPFRQQLAAKVWVDITNPFNADYSDFVLPWNTSSAEEIQRAFPESRVVGAFKNVWWEMFDAPTFGDSKSDVFLVGNDRAAKQLLLDLLAETDFRYLDAGPLENARTVERMSLLSGQLGDRYGYFPRMNYRMLGERRPVQRNLAPALAG